MSIRNVIFFLSSLGAVLSLSLTALRFTSSFGIGELLMLLSLVIFLLMYKKLKKNRKAPSKFVLSFFIFCLLGFVCTIFFFQEVQSEAFFGEAVRTFFAYLFSMTTALMISTLILTKEDFSTLIKFILQCCMATMVVVVVVNFSEFLSTVVSLGGGARFYGFSKNPNQIGSLIVPIPLIAMYLYKIKKINKWFYIFSLVMWLLLAIAVGSDALNYSLLLCLTLFVILNLNKFSFGLKTIMLILVSAFLFYISDDVYDYILNTNNNNNQASVRYLLWNNAFIGWLESPLIGFGPGSYSGLTGPFEGAESHNTFIDLLTNVGLIGFVMFLSFIIKLEYYFLKLREYQIFFIVFAYLCFGLFHNILRHPMYWILLFSVYSYKNLLETNVDIRSNSSI